MQRSEIVAIIEKAVPGSVLGESVDAGDPFIRIDPTGWHDAAKVIHSHEQLAFDVLNCISGVDFFEPDAKKAAKCGFEPHFEVVYHLSSFRFRNRLTIKLVLPRWRGGQSGALPEVASVADIWRTAEWHEREVYDLCGVWFTGHPDLRRILLAEDWEGHPLRKDYVFPLEYHGTRCR